MKFIDCKFGPMEEKEEKEEGERAAGERDGNLHTQRRTKNDHVRLLLMLLLMPVAEDKIIKMQFHCCSAACRNCNSVR